MEYAWICITLTGVLNAIVLFVIGIEISRIHREITDICLQIDNNK